MSPLLRLLREPLVHFAVVGVVLFGADRWLSPSSREPPSSPDPRVIRLSDEVRGELVENFRHRQGRDPTVAELSLASERWLEDEVLYREGLQLGLAGDDLLIRNRVIEKMRFVLSNTAPVREPGEDELRAWLSERHADYEQPRRYDFEHLELWGETPEAELKDAEGLLAKLSGGLPPESLGARYRPYEGRSAANVDAMFGAGTEAQLAALPLNVWRVVERDGVDPRGGVQPASAGTRPRPKRLHVFRVLAVAGGVERDFDSLRSELTLDWKRDQQQRATEERLSEMQRLYRARGRRVRGVSRAWHRFALLALAVLLSAADGHAHYVGTALLHLVEQAEPGTFTLRFIPSTAMQRSDGVPVPVYPPQCRKLDDRLSCDAPGLVGELRVDGLMPSAELIVKIDWQSGRRLTRVLTGRRDRTEIEPALHQRGAGEVLVEYGRLGAVHIAEGADHLLFVLGLVLMVGFGRRLLWTITGFTLAHSLTLALSVTGLVVLRPLPVEALIAFSLMLVAGEAWRATVSPAARPETLAPRFPWSFAFGFGLVHGLGFGGALIEIGLPDADLGLALLAFNLGVEMGQVLFVGLLVGLVRGARASLGAGQRIRHLARGAATYVVGCSGAYLFIVRVAALVVALLLAGTGVSQACPEDERAPAEPIALSRQGGVWQLSIPHAVLHHERVLERPEVAAALSMELRAALQKHLPLLTLMDQIGRRQGVVVVGVGDQAPFLVVPSGRSPYERLVALERARGGGRLASLGELLRLPPGTDPDRYYTALRGVLPNYPEPVLPSTYGKLVGAECNIGAREKFLLLALADGKVALLSRAGFLRYAADARGGVAADARKLGDAEGWQIERRDVYTVSFRSRAGTYLRWGARNFYELDAGATQIESAPVFQHNHERFFLWANGDGTVSLKLADNRVSVSVVEWQIPRQGLDVNCHHFGYRQDPSDAPLPISISLGSPP